MKADGILGLSPTNQGTQASLIYDKLSSNKVFSLAIAENVGQSKMTFGGFNMEKFAKVGSTPIIWHQLTSTKYWQIKFTGASFGLATISFTVDQMIIDSGTSYLLMPSEDYLQFTTLLNQISPCTMNKYS